jgi:hypothetical protein
LLLHVKKKRRRRSRGFSFNVVIPSSLDLLVVVACEDEKKEDPIDSFVLISRSLHFDGVECEEQ